VVDSGDIDSPPEAVDIGDVDNLTASDVVDGLADASVDLLLEWFEQTRANVDVNIEMALNPLSVACDHPLADSSDESISRPVHQAA
jgi:hypothetical protein